MMRIRRESVIGTAVIANGIGLALLAAGLSERVHSSPEHPSDLDTYLVARQFEAAGGGVLAFTAGALVLHAALRRPDEMPIAPVAELPSPADVPPMPQTAAPAIGATAVPHTRSA